MMLLMTYGCYMLKNIYDAIDDDGYD